MQADGARFKSCAATYELGDKGRILNLSELQFLYLENGERWR